MSDNLEAHIVPWLVELVPQRLYVGPMPSAEKDALYVRDVLQATHVFNMAPETDRRIRGLPASIWYVTHWKEGAPVQERAPLPPDMNSLSDAKKLAYYAECVQRIHGILGVEKTCVYVHQRSGLEEEALAGLAAWARLQPDAAPRDLNAWCTRNHYELMMDSEEMRALAATAMQQARVASKPSGLARFGIKRQKKETQ